MSIFNNPSGPSRKLFTNNNSQNSSTSNSTSMSLFTNNNTSGNIPSHNSQPNQQNSNPITESRPSVNLLQPSSSQRAPVNSTQFDAPKYRHSFQEIFLKVTKKEKLSHEQVVFLSEGCYFFEKSEEQTKRFKILQEKPHLGFSREQKYYDGEILQCKQVDAIWVKLVMHFSKMTETHQMNGYVFLKRILRQTKIYQKLFKPAPGMLNRVFTPNLDFIREFYVNTINQPKVSVDSQKYQELLTGMIMQYYREYTAFFNCLSYLMKSQNFKRSLYFDQKSSQNISSQQLDSSRNGSNSPQTNLSPNTKNNHNNNRRLFKDLLDRGLIKQLWHFYKVFSNSQQNKKFNTVEGQNSLQEDNHNSPIKQSISQFRSASFLRIGQILIFVLKRYFKQETIMKNSPLNLLEVLTFIKGDVEYSQQYGLYNPKIECQFLQKSTEIILELIPFLAFAKDQELIRTLRTKNIVNKLSTEQENQILDFMKNWNHPSFIGLKIFATNELVERRKISRQQKYQLNKIEKLIQSKNWNMHSESWGYWFGVLISTFKSQQIMSFASVKNQFINMCKKCVKSRPNEFWSVLKNAKNYQAQYMMNQRRMTERQQEQQDTEKTINPNLFHLNSIEKFLSQILKDDNRSEGLRVFTKLMKETFDGETFDGSAQNLDKTVKFFGQDALQQIVLTIGQGLCLQGQIFESQMRISNSMMFNNGQSRKFTIEHELKFICQLIKSNKENLDKLQQCLFGRRQQVQIQSRQSYNLTTFLCLCIKKLEQFNVEETKYLRYIIQAIDCLFCYQDSKKSVLMVLSMIFTTQPIYASQKQRVPYMLRIVDCCAKIPREHAQLNRQRQKLKIVLSKHLYHLVLYSDSISANFPLSFNRNLNEERLKIFKNDLINLRDHGYTSPQVYKQSSMPLQPYEWFYPLCNLLCVRNLQPIDYLTVMQLLNKFKLTEKYQQTECIQMIVNILNQSDFLVQNVLDGLTPDITPEQERKVFQREYFGLDSHHIRKCEVQKTASLQSVILGGSNFGITSDLLEENIKYRNQVYLNSKKQKHLKENFDSIKRKINAIMHLIEKILSIKLQSTYRNKDYGSVESDKKEKNIIEKQNFNQIQLFSAFPLIDRIQPIRILLLKLTKKQWIHVYTIVYIQYESKKMATAYVNILAVLLSYIRLEKSHKISPAITYFDHFDNKYLNLVPEKETFQMFREYTYHIESSYFSNILYEGKTYNFQQQVSTKGSILRTLQTLILLGQNGIVGKCLNNYSYPKQLSFHGSEYVSVFSNRSLKAQILVKQVISGIISSDESRLLKIQAFQCLFVMLKASLFSQYIINDLQIIRTVITDMLETSYSQISLLNKITLFMYGLSQLDRKHMQSNDQSDRLQQSTIQRFFVYPSHLAQLILKKLLRIAPRYSITKIKISKTSNQLSNYLYKKVLNQHTMYRSTLNILIELFHDNLLYLGEIEVKSFFKLLIADADIFLQKPISIGTPQLYHKLGVSSQNILVFYNDNRENSRSHFYVSQFDQNHQNSLSIQPFRYGTRYYYDIIHAYNMLKSSEYEQKYNNDNHFNNNGENGYLSNDFDNNFDHLQFFQDNVNSQIQFMQVLNCYKGLQHTYHMLHRSYTSLILFFMGLGPSGQNISNFTLDSYLDLTTKQYSKQMQYGKFTVSRELTSLGILGSIGLNTAEKIQSLKAFCDVLFSHVMTAREISSGILVAKQHDRRILQGYLEYNNNNGQGQGYRRGQYLSPQYALQVIKDDTLNELLANPNNNQFTSLNKAMTHQLIQKVLQIMLVSFVEQYGHPGSGRYYEQITRVPEEREPEARQRRGSFLPSSINSLRGNLNRHRQDEVFEKLEQIMITYCGVLLKQMDSEVGKQMAMPKSISNIQGHPCPNRILLRNLFMGIGTLVSVRFEIFELKNFYLGRQSSVRNYIEQTQKLLQIIEKIMHFSLKRNNRNQQRHTSRNSLNGIPQPLGMHCYQQAEIILNMNIICSVCDMALTHLGKYSEYLYLQLSSQSVQQSQRILQSSFFNHNLNHNSDFDIINTVKSTINYIIVMMMTGPQQLYQKSPIQLTKISLLSLCIKFYQFESFSQPQIPTPLNKWKFFHRHFTIVENILFNKEQMSLIPITALQRMRALQSLGTFVMLDQGLFMKQTVQYLFELVEVNEKYVSQYKTVSMRRGICYSQEENKNSDNTRQNKTVKKKPLSSTQLLSKDGDHFINNKKSKFKKYHLRLTPGQKQQRLSSLSLEQLIEYRTLFSTLLVVASCNNVWNDVNCRVEFNALWIQVLNCTLFNFQPESIIPALSVEKYLAELKVWQDDKGAQGLGREGSRSNSSSQYLGQTAYFGQRIQRSQQGYCSAPSHQHSLQQRHSTHQNLYEFICFVEYHQLATTFLLLLQQGNSKSSLFISNQSSSFSSTTTTSTVMSLQQHFQIWSNITSLYNKIYKFYVDACVLYLENQNLTKNLICLHAYVCQQSSFLNEFECLSLQFQRFGGVKDFKKSLVDSVLLYVESLLGVGASWRAAEWKGRKSWAHERAGLFTQAYQLLNKNAMLETANCYQEGYGNRGTVDGHQSCNNRGLNNTIQQMKFVLKKQIEIEREFIEEINFNSSI